MQLAFFQNVRSLTTLFGTLRYRDVTIPELALIEEVLFIPRGTISPPQFSDLDDTSREAILNEANEEILRIIRSRAPQNQRREIIWALRPFADFFEFARDVAMRLYSILRIDISFYI